MRANVSRVGVFQNFNVSPCEITVFHTIIECIFHFNNKNLYNCALDSHGLFCRSNIVGRASRFLCNNRICMYVICLLMIVFIFQRNIKYADYLYFVFERNKVDYIAPRL